MKRLLPLLVALAALPALAQYVPTKSGIVVVTTAPVGSCTPSTNPDQWICCGSDKGKTYHCDGAGEDMDGDGTVNEWTVVPATAANAGGASGDVQRNSAGAFASSGMTSNGTDLTVSTGGQLILSNKGTEFTESDTNPTCAANNFNLYADNSEQAFNVCDDGTARYLAMSLKSQASGVTCNDNDLARF